MITKLTSEQEKGIQEWREYCLQIGRDTAPVNRPLVEESWKKFYKILGKKEPFFWYCQSPLQAQIIINIFPEIGTCIKGLNKGANIRANIGDNIRANIGANIWDNIRANISDNISDNIWVNIRANIVANIWANIRDNIWANIKANIWANIKVNIWVNIWVNIRDNIRDNISDNIKANIVANIVANIRANIWANIRDNIWANIRDNIWAMKLKHQDTYSWGQHDIAWIAYYKYFEEYGLLPHDKNFDIFDIWYDLACSCGWSYTFENIVFVCEKPCELHLNSRGQLHKDGGMALKYSDGYGLYMLNGIRVPKEIVETPAEKLDPKIALNEKNTDVQREIIRKIGYERMLVACNAKTLESWQCPKTGLRYEVKQMTIGDINRRYLCYEHASMPGIFYAKCMPPEAKTIVQMRAFQTGVFGFDPEQARDRLGKNELTDDELIVKLPETVQ